MTRIERKIALVLWTQRPRSKRGSAWTCWLGIVFEMAHMLSKDNPRFHFGRFFGACGTEDK